MAKIKAKVNFDGYIVGGNAYNVVFFTESGVLVYDSGGEHFILDKGEYEVIEE